VTLVWLALAVWALGWTLNAWLTRGARAASTAVRIAVPLIFGATILLVWELVVRGLEVPRVILPPPSMIGATFVTNLPLLWRDFVQTIVFGAMSGLIIGTAAALVVGILVDRFDGLRRGLLPVGNFMAALPIVGTAPIS
jgi:NitT/TauT family transport system permease protein